MIEDLGQVVAWKYGVPFTRRGDVVEIEGIGPVDLKTLEAARAEWRKRPAEKIEPSSAEIMVAIRRHDPALAAAVDAEIAKRASVR